MRSFWQSNATSRCGRATDKSRSDSVAVMPSPEQPWYLVWAGPWSIEAAWRTLDLLTEGSRGGPGVGGDFGLLNRLESPQVLAKGLVPKDSWTMMTNRP